MGEKKEKKTKINKQTNKKSMWRGESYNTFPTPFRVLVN